MKYFFIVLIGALMVLSSCDSIIAEDITGKTPVLILPSENDTIDVNPVHFKWQEMEGASKYHLMVVSPSFNNINAYVLDTMVTGTNFFYDLDSNEYELMLAGTNAGYVSDTLGPIKFWVGTSVSTSGGSVTLTSPLDGVYVNETFNNSFTWDPVTSATHYEYSIREGSSFGTGSIVESQTNIVASNYPLAATLAEGEYHWGVKAYFAGSETNFSIHTLYVDTVNPNSATLATPSNGQFLPPGATTFTWNNGTDQGTIQSPVYSLIEIASDNGFGTIIESDDLIGTTADFNLSAGTYYWRVSNYDEAGNLAPVSSIFNITIQ